MIVPMCRLKSGELFDPTDLRRVKPYGERQVVLSYLHGDRHAELLLTGTVEEVEEQIREWTKQVRANELQVRQAKDGPYR